MPNLIIVISNTVIFSWGLGMFGTIFVASDCPPRKQLQGGIVPVPRNGTPTELWAYPFVVSLIEQHEVTKLYRHWCGGALVTLKVVLTSCGCIGVFEKSKTVVHERCKQLIVLGGTPDMYYNGSVHKQLRTPSECKLHPICRLEQEITADVALVLLTEQFMLTTHTKPMKLFTTDRGTFVNKLDELTALGTLCYQPGWDAALVNYGVKPAFPGWITEGKGQLINWKKCNEMHCIFEDEGPVCRNEFLLGDFCATTYQGIAPTTSETGGPLICHGWVIGITSIPSCDACSPSLYIGPGVWLDLIYEYIDHVKPYSAAPFKRQCSVTSMVLWTFGVFYING